MVYGPETREQYIERMKREGKKEQGPETREEYIERTKHTRPPQGPQRKPRPGPVTEEGQFYTKKDEILTREEYLEQKVDPAIEEMEYHMGTINPYGTYVYKDKWGQDTFVSGQTLLDRYEKEGTLTELKEHREEVKDLPRGAKFRETDKGYEMIPASPLSWHRHYKSRMSELPPVASEISRFGFGGFSVFAGLAKTPLSWIGLGKEFDIYSTVGVSSAVNPFDTKGTLEDVGTGLDKSRWGVHYVSPFDVAFEPIGWSPVGSSREITRDPWFAAGGIVGEIGVAAMFHGGFEGVKTGVRYGIRKAPVVYSKFSQVFPEEKLIFESGRMVHTSPTRSFVSRFGQTKTWRTMSRWASGDIIKVRRLPLHKTIKFNDEGLTSRLDIYKGFGRKEWVPRRVLEQAQKAETFHIHKYTPWRTRYQAFVTEKVYPSKGHLWWKTAKRQITTFSEHEKMVKMFEPADFWSGSVKIRPDVPVTGYKISFIDDTRGMASLVYRPVHLHRPMVHTSPVHTGYLGSGSIVTQVPMSGVAPLMATGLLSGLALQSKMDYRSELSFKPVSGTVKTTKVSPSQVNLLDTGLVQVPISASLQSSRLKTKSVEKYDTAKAVKVAPVSVKPAMSHGSMKFIPFIPVGGVRARRRKRSLYDPLFSGYKFRLFEFKKGVYKSPFKKI